MLESIFLINGLRCGYELHRHRCHLRPVKCFHNISDRFIYFPPFFVVFFRLDCVALNANTIVWASIVKRKGSLYDDGRRDRQRRGTRATPSGLLSILRMG